MSDSFNSINLQILQASLETEPLRKAPLVFDAETHPEQKPFVELWRIQNSKGEGPYQGMDDYSQWTDPDHESRTPTPEFDPGFQQTSNEWRAYGGQKHKFGFESMEHLNNWFSPAEQQRLANHGYKPTKIKAKKVYSSGKQAFYEPYDEETSAAPQQAEQKLTASEWQWIPFTEPLEKKEHTGLCCMFLFEGVKHPDILHTTHHYFKTIKDPQDIIDVLEKYFKTHPFHSFKPTFKDVELFGENKDVRVLRPADQQKKMFLLDLKEQLDELEKDKYREYKPHVSVSSNVDEVNFPIVNYALVQGGKILWAVNEELSKSETYEEETERLREKKKSPEAMKPHKFKAAQWTFPNGHPRCAICMDEERIGGVCEGRKEDVSKSEDLIKSKNVREQRKKVWGKKAQPAAGSDMRNKHIAHIVNFAKQFLNLDLQPSGGKIDPKTGERKSDSAMPGIDKPDWRSGTLEAQWQPDAIMHELAHLMLLPAGIGLKEGQTHMDKEYADIQRKYGYMKQKQSQGEVQPMAAENIIRRHLGLPANTNSVPAKSPDAPPRVSVEDPNIVIGTRISTKNKNGTVTAKDLIRQSRFLNPANKQRLDDVFSGKLIFNPEHGWVPKQDWRTSYTSKQPPAQAAEESSPVQVVHKEMNLQTKHLPEEQLKAKMLNEGSLIYHPDKGFITERRMVNRGKDEPLLRNEEGPISLVHYSKVPSLKEIRTDKMGTGAPSQEYKRGFPEVKRAYYYRAGTQPEDIVKHGARSKYTATLQPHQKLYDLAKDHQGLVKQAIAANQGAWNSDLILNNIKNAGYHGYHNSASALPNVVALFHPHPVESEEMV
jgi:hypothetical protein